ncbi:hypothetical protein JTB14_016972 [Gonioctena quinquepunctata]|nr:hypothetical protein JTB14_016972 [Gonioctena quinquepunctata]
MVRSKKWKIEIPILDTSHNTYDLFPAKEGIKEQKDVVPTESQHSLENTEMNSPLSPTPSTLQEDKNSEIEISNAKNNVLHEKTQSQEISGIHHTFRQTCDVPENDFGKKSSLSLDVEKLQILHSCKNTCADPPRNPLPSTYKGGTNLDPPSNAPFGKPKETEKNQPQNQVSPNINAEIGEVRKTELLENQNIEVPKNIFGDIEMGGNIEDPTKILGMFHDQLSPDKGLFAVEGFPFVPPNINSGAEDGNNKDLANKPLRSMEAGSKPGTDKQIKYDSVTIKEADKNPDVGLREAMNIPKENIIINSEGKYSVNLSEMAKEHKIREGYNSA